MSTTNQRMSKIYPLTHTLLQKGLSAINWDTMSDEQVERTLFESYYAGDQDIANEANLELSARGYVDEKDRSDEGWEPVTN